MEEIIIILSLHLVLTNLFISGAYSSARFTVTNNCEETIWPGILSNAGAPPLSTTGFALRSSESRVLDAPPSWGGRIWGRTHCSLDSAGKFACVTGDCGSGTLECGGRNAAPPATLAEFALDGNRGLDFYDVSLVDGYNVPMLVAPHGGSGSSGNCTNTGCVADLNGSCPVALKVTGSTGQSAACKSACEAFGDPHYCCSGAFGTPNTGKPSSYSQMFKIACPRAYSYAYDDKTSIFTCPAGSTYYVITFCPSPDSRTKTTSPMGGQNPVADDGGDSGRQSIIDNTIVYEGASNACAQTKCQITAITIVIVTIITFLMTFKFFLI